MVYIEYLKFLELFTKSSQMSRNFCNLRERM